VDKKPLIGRKCLAVGIILLLVLVSLPLVSSVPIEKEQSVISKNCFDGIIIYGTLGENGWYVSDVHVSFDFPANSTIHFKINDNGWQIYTGGPLFVNTDGLYNVSAYYVDNEGHQSPIYYATFKIDKTLPNLTSFTVKRGGFFKWLFYANASDKTSGINRVEFYFLHRLLSIDTHFPYEVNWTGIVFIVWWKYIRHDWTNLPHCIAYDNAGNPNVESP